MHRKDKNLSLQFYNYLCNIVGSEEVVRTRREIFTAKDIVESSTPVTLISSGSKAEGLDLKGSDYDQMVQLNFYRVYKSLNEVQSDPGKIPLVMVTNDTKPGFTKLKLVSKGYLDSFLVNVSLGEVVGEEMYISSKRFRESFLHPDMVIHGPCHSSPGEEVDSVRCFRCEEWTTTAQQWIHRSRTTWPDYTLVTSAVQYGVLFVPIGCKDSPNEDLQWRISFSVTEKLLVHSFSHSQLLCYALIKIILKDIIKPRHGDLLCSYFLKTIMFWLSEELSPLEWKPERMISCFLDSIKRLIYCVEYRTCLHYFIPENNLFEDRFTNDEHKELLDTLRFIYESPWASVFDTATFQNWRLTQLNAHGMTLKSSVLSCFFYTGYNFISSYSFYNFLQAIFKTYKYSLKRELRKYTLSFYSREYMQSADLCNLSDRNKSFYIQYNRLLGRFKIALHSDSIYSWLMLASLFYKCKRFQECTNIINNGLSNCTPDKIHIYPENQLTEQTIFQDMVQRYGLLLARKYLIIEFIVFKYPFNILPNELTPLINEVVLILPPVFYCHLLNFLCSYQLEDYRGKLNAVRDLALTVREGYFIPQTDRMLIIVNKSLEIVISLLG